MIDHESKSHPIATWAGLFLAMFGTPLFLWALRLDVGEARSLPSYLGREAGVFLMFALLLWIVRKGEHLPYSSIGWRVDQLGSSIRWGLLGAVLIFVALAACLVVAQALDWKIGLQEPARYTPPLWAMAITVLRAGVTEEAFYRGYAMERLQTLTGSKAAAVALTVVPFALFHYRQGPAGILIAFVAALILSWLYLKRRDLPANMLAHFTVDFVPNIVLPIFGVV